jgi:hypothetical protein
MNPHELFEMTDEFMNLGARQSTVARRARCCCNFDQKRSDDSLILDTQ